MSQCSGEESLQSVGTVHWGLDLRGIAVLDLRPVSAMKTDLLCHELVSTCFNWMWTRGCGGAGGALAIVVACYCRNVLEVEAVEAVAVVKAVKPVVAAATAAVAVSDGAASAAVGAARAAVSVVCMLFFYSAHTHIFFSYSCTVVWWSGRYAKITWVSDQTQWLMRWEQHNSLDKGPWM